MKNLLAALLALLLLTTTAWAGPCRAIKTDPADGARGVPVSLKQITIWFDEPMKTDGWSFIKLPQMGMFPEVAGDPKFIGPQKCILPVKLTRLTTYAFGINGVRLRHFRAATSPFAACMPKVIVFTTGE